MMDGISAMDTGNNGQMINMNIESIGEIKVLTQGYQAEYGRSSGLQITAVTKSGTNRFRGSVYDVQRNSDWWGNSVVNKKNGNPKAVLKEKDWGYSIGGPIGKPGGSNKLFFFYSQEFSPRTAGALLYLIFVGAIGGFSAYAYALKHLPVATVSLYAYVNPIIAVVLGALILSEPFNARMFVAAVIVFIGVALVRTKG